MYVKRWLFLWLAMCIATAIGAANDKFTLVIDAGHGGNDAGALGKYSKEKNINLKVALAFGRYVERNCPDVKVIYTRKTDVFIPLHKRADIANSNKADLFISIHTNALPGKRIARGLETYTLGMNRASENFDVAKRENSVILIEKDYKQHYEGFDPRSSESYIMFEFMQDKNMEQSVELAKLVQKRTCAAANRPNKGVKQAGFLVLRETSMPSCLIELGFITTPDEEKFLNSESGVDALGKGIYQAFADYKNKYDKNKNVRYKANTKSEKDGTSLKTNTTNTVPAEVTAAGNGSKKDKRNSKSIVKELTDARNGTATETPNNTNAGRDKAVQTEAAQPEPVKQKRPVPQPETVKEADAKNEKETSEKPEAQENAGETGTETKETKQETGTGEPVFKVQILASSTNLSTTDKQLKGTENIDMYQENGLYKYTVGSSTDYNEIFRLRKSILDKYPEAFIIAFKDGKKMNVAEAVREFKANRNKK